MKPVMWTKPWREGWPMLGVGLMLTLASAAVAGAPTEQTMGDAQRILYLHVAVAWWGLLSFFALALCGLGYLARRTQGWDAWFQAIAEVGWLCASLTLISGSLWARAAWGSWWTWDPRLVTSFILWAMYSGILILRMGLDDPQRKAQLSSVLAIIGVADVPLVIMATRWFRGVHPVAPQLDPAMRLTLWTSVVGCTAFMVYLVTRRRTQISLAARITELEMRTQEI